jgi:hypothetical protein
MIKNVATRNTIRDYQSKVIHKVLLAFTRSENLSKRIHTGKHNYPLAFPPQNIGLYSLTTR